MQAAKLYFYEVAPQLWKFAGMALNVNAGKLSKPKQRMPQWVSGFECVDTHSFWHLVFGFLFPRKALMFGTVWLEVLLWKMQLIQYHSHLVQRDFFREARSAFRLQRLEPWKGSRSCHRVTCFSASLYPYITPRRQWKSLKGSPESLFEYEADFATKRQLVRANRREEEDNSGGATSCL